MKQIITAFVLIFLAAYPDMALPTGFSDTRTLVDSRYWGDFASGNLDNNKLPDIVYSHRDSNLVIALNDGFTVKSTTLEAVLQTISTITIDDFDGDGDNDILIGGLPKSSSGKRLFILLNNKTGTWGDTVVVNCTGNSVSTARFADIDKDGDLDIVAIGSTGVGKLFWYERKNSSWTEHLISDTLIGNYTSPHWFDIADFTNDSLPDIVCGSSSANQDRLILFTNNGHSGFTPVYIDNFIKLNHGIAADVNYDGYTDIFTGKEWFQNTGNGTFTKKEFSQPLTNNADDLAAADINNDGFPDLAASVYNEGIYVWQSEKGLSFSRKLLTNSNGSKKLYFSDMDNDNFIDIVHLNVKENIITQIHNDASFAFEKIALCNDSGLLHYDLADFDNDSDSDFVLYSQTNYRKSNKITVFENSGNRTFTKRFSSTALSTYTSSDNFSIQAVDFDGDKGIDIVANNKDALAWYKFSDINSFTLDTLWEKGDSLQKFYALDFDADKKMDFMVQFNANRNASVVYFKNEGNGAFTYQELSTGCELVNCDDFNRDGKWDYCIASVSSVNPRFCFIGFGNGDGIFTVKKIPDCATLIPSDLKPVDLDNDKDPDFIIASADSGKYGWIENIGDTTNDGYAEYAVHILRSNISSPSEDIAGDIDNDKRVDIIQYSLTDKCLEWMRQDSGCVFRSPLLVSKGVVKGDCRLYDIDNDGWTDILCVEGKSVVCYRNLLGVPPAKPQVPVSVAKQHPGNSFHSIRIQKNGKNSLILHTASPVLPGMVINFYLVNGQLVLSQRISGSPLTIDLPQVNNLVVWRICNVDGSVKMHGKIPMSQD